MLEKKKISIYYFSGTGNTYTICKEICRIFNARNYEAELIPLTNIDPREVKIDGTIGLAFPVAVQSTFPLVWDFVEKMPKTVGTKIFMLDTMQMFSGGVVGPLKKKLSAKGYNCIGAMEFKMPSNMRTKEKPDESFELIIGKSIVKAEKFVESLINETSSWPRIPLASDLMRQISASESLWQRMSEHYACVKCGLCQKICPMESIKMNNDSYPKNSNNCISCMRCANYCPNNAIKLKGKSLVQNNPIKVSEFL